MKSITPPKILQNAMLKRLNVLTGKAGVREILVRISFGTILFPTADKPEFAEVWEVFSALSKTMT